MDPITKADVKEQTEFETAPAQPMLTEGEPARELLLEEVSGDGMRGAY